MAVMQAFMDASEGEGFLAIGCYLFKKSQAKAFSRKWSNMLRRYGLEYFHMADCNIEAGPFKHLTKKQCDDVARSAISLIGEFAIEGITIAVDCEAFDNLSIARLHPSPFSLAAYSAIIKISHWAHKHDPKARIVYVYEAGDAFQKDANTILSAIADDPERAAHYCYEDHAFLTKRGSKPTQAADILAWHCRKQWGRERREIDRLRGDFAELVTNVRTDKFLWDWDHLNEMMNGINEVAQHPAWPEVVKHELRRTAANARQIDRAVAKLLAPGD